MNIHNIVQLYVYSEEYNTTSSGMIISSKISEEFIQLPENGTVQLKFNNVSIYTTCKIVGNDHHYKISSLHQAFWKP